MSGAKIIKQADEVVDAAKANKLHHIFDKPGRGLEPFVESAGGKNQAYELVQQAIENHVTARKITGEYAEIIYVNGFKLKVKGKIGNGEVKIGTFRPID